MSSISETHIKHTELISEIDFMKIEIRFLMKVLRNAYCPSIVDDKVKSLDSYWKIFESITQQLDQILIKAKKEEKVLAGRIKNEHLSIDKNITIQESIITEDSSEEAYKKLFKEIKTYKESFYDYMIDCKDCMIKKV